jgi:uncharacterized membrane protein
MTWLDWAALVLFFICWLGYGPLLKLLARGSGSLNDDMLTVRQAWMTAMTHREIRLLDSQLLGHSINSGSFFASSNLLLIAAVGGILFGGQGALEGFASVGAEDVPIQLLESKLALVLVCLARGLLDFIWSIRQMNYALALIGAAPEVHSEHDKVAFGQATADVLNPALAAAAWLFGPLWLALGVASAFSLLVWRQAGSPAARAIRTAKRLLDANTPS